MEICTFLAENSSQKWQNWLGSGNIWGTFILQLWFEIVYHIIKLGRHPDPLPMTHPNGHGSGVKPHVLGDGESLGTIFRSLRSTWQSRMGWRGCRGSRMTSRSESLTWGVIQLLNMLKTWFWGQNPCFGWWGILWDNFQEPHADVRCLEWDVYFGTKNTTDFHPQGKTNTLFLTFRSKPSSE